MTNEQLRMMAFPSRSPLITPLRHSSFAISSFVIRHSSFVIPHSSHLSLQTSIELDDVRVAHACAAKDVEGRADGEVDSPAADAGDFLQVCQGLRAAGVGRGNRRPL